MNQVPYLGSYGYVAPVVPLPAPSSSSSIALRILTSPLFLVGVILFVVAAIVYNTAKKKRKEETQLAKEKVNLDEAKKSPPNHNHNSGFTRFNFDM